MPPWVRRSKQCFLFGEGMGKDTSKILNPPHLQVSVPQKTPIHVFWGREFN